MLAINMSIRSDMYGVFCGFVLGLVLIIPRCYLKHMWRVLTVLYGLLLTIQYVFLLGFPYGACVRDNESMFALNGCIIVCKIV